MVIKNKKMKQVFIFLFLLVHANFLYAQPTVPGNLSSTDTLVCSSTNNGSLALVGFAGNIVRWEYSVSGGDPWTPLANTSSIYNFTNLVNSMYFRVVVKAPTSLPATSNNLFIQVLTPSYGGNIIGSHDQCLNDNGVLKVENQIGKILQWEISTNNGSSWSPSPNTQDSIQIYRNFNQNILYRTLVKNKICATSTSAPFSIITHSLNVGGTISGIDSICTTSNLVDLNLNGSNGTKYLWEAANSPSGPWVNTGIQTTNLQLSNVQQSQFYRVKVGNQACPSVYSNIFKVLASSPSVGGSIGGLESICENKSVALQLANYTGKISTWQYSTDQTNWSLLANTTDTLKTANLATTHYYRVKLNNGVCPAVFSATKTIQVESLPIPVFSFASNCSRKAVAIQNSTVGNNNYQWFFGDGLSELVKNPIHTFLQEGAYPITLKVTSLNGCFDSVTQVIQIHPTPIADFITLDTLCFQDNVLFSNSSTISSGSITTFNWTFNQSSTSSVQNPVLNQLQLGNNNVKLKAVSNYGCIDTIMKTIVLRDKPSSQFQVQNVCFGSPSIFHNQSFAGASQSNYFWDIGEGVYTSSQNPQHTFQSSGYHQIQLKTVTNFGCKDSISITTFIKPLPVIDFTFADNCYQDSSFFIAQIDSVQNYTVLWNLENGVTSSLNNPSLIFSNYGQYPVQLKVTSDSNCIALANHSIHIFPKPTANFVVPNACAMDSIGFTNLGTIPYGSFTSQWNFGNGNSSSSNSPIGFYDTSAVYYPVLTLVSNIGCIDSISKPIVIYDTPIANFTFVNVCDGFPIVFTNTSHVNYGQIDNNLWNFGDNSNSSLLNPTKEYLNDGSYTVSLIVSSSTGCKDTIQKNVVIYEAPVANFEVLNACDGQEVTFNNTTVLNAGMFSTTWDLGDGTISTEYAPSYLYEAAGIYQVKQVIETDLGCIDSILKVVVIYPLPNVQIVPDTIEINKGEKVYLKVSGAEYYTWYPSTAMNNPLISNPIVQPESSIQYFVTGMDNYQCISSDSVYIIVNDSYSVTPYNFISPDGNGQNETWVIENILSYTDNTIIIYDEMGHEVFKQNGYDNTWNGKNKTGEILPDGMYYYIISFQKSDRKYNGSILLLRNK